MSFTSFDLARERQVELLVAAHQRQAQRRTATAQRLERKALRLARRAEHAASRARSALARA